MSKVYYLSGMLTPASVAVIKNRLLSFHYRRETEKEMTWHKPDRLFCDSGAFSAFTKGVEVNLQEYIEFCHEYEDRLTVIAALDVIGDHVKSFENCLRMLDAGVNCIPTFHFGEPWSALEKIVEDFDYIALGGVAQLKGGDSLGNWLDSCWRIICDERGRPRTKVHGFAVTSIGPMRRYPWESVDSSSWMYSTAMGKVLMWDGKRLRALAVGERSPTLRELNGEHYCNRPEIEKAKWDAFFESHGYDYDEVATVIASRGIVNAKEVAKTTEIIPDTFINRQQGLF